MGGAGTDDNTESRLMATYSDHSGCDCASVVIQTAVDKLYAQWSLLVYAVNVLIKLP